MKKYKHIISNAHILGGKPIVEGTRISVDLILEWIASGGTIETIVMAYPQLTTEAVKEAILYATDYLKNEILIESKVA
jgi:uncharacterized protein (DUF433 family)